MKKTGFTLLEISIVLVIIGLIVGGVLVGRHLIRASEIRSVATDIQEYNSDISMFKNKYGEAPGDFSGATRFWGRADGGTPSTANCANPDTDISAANPQATCNGNGNGLIADTASVAQQNTEAYRAWQHLSNAGMIPGNYSGVGGAMSAYNWRAAILGTNIPKSKIIGSGYWISMIALNASCSVPNLWTGVDVTIVRNRIGFGADTIIAPPWNPSLTPAEAHSLDDKIDDGKPGMGNMTVYCAAICSDTTDAATAKYQNTDDARICSTLFVIN